MDAHRTIRPAIGVAIAGLVAAGCVTVARPAIAQPRPAELTTGDYAAFYDDLAPYGDWVRVPGYGWAWRPLGVAADWRPYTNGSWVYSDDGWTWVSTYPWGWAAFHYGRWVLDRRYGWVWIPGHVWGPAWVAWRWGPGWIGWAPLPPEAVWSPGIGIVYHGDIGVIIAPTWWCFVPERRFLAPRIHRYVVRRHRNPGLIRRSPYRRAWRVRQGRPVNAGIPVRRIERSVGHRVKPVRVIEATRAPRGRPARVQGGTLRVYRPPRLRARAAPVRPGRPVTPPRARPATPPRARPATPPRARPAPVRRARPANPPRARPATPPRARPATPPRARPAPVRRVRPATPPRARPAPVRRARPAPPARARPAPKKATKPKGKPAQKEDRKARPARNEHRSRR